MVSIVKKMIKGNEYLYLVRSVREGDKVRQQNIKYIGRKRPISRHEFECMKISAEEKDWVLLGHEEFLPYQEHARLRETSDNEKKRIGSLDKVSQEKEKERFLSSFIANSNAIEGSTMTVDETHDFLFGDIAPAGHTKKELFMASNLLKAWKYVEKNQRHLPTEEDIKTLHKMVNENVETDETLGKYKQVQNYVGNSYTTSQLFVEERMKRLMKWIKRGFREMDDFEVAFQSHAQFEIIHPFIDGNGRVGRLLMNWLLMSRGLTFFAIRIKSRNDYLTALRNGQAGKVEAICIFCLKEYLNQYMFY